MFSKAKRILASELSTPRAWTRTEAREYLEEVLERSRYAQQGAGVARSFFKLSLPEADSPTDM